MFPLVRHRRRAFTLLELIVVLVVLAIVALIAIPTFNNIIAGGAQRSALTTAQAVARDAASIAKLAGAPPNNGHLRQAAVEVDNKDLNMQIAYRGDDTLQNGVVGVKVSTSGNQNVRYACVFIGDLSGTAAVLAKAAPGGTCPTTDFDGSAQASNVLAGGFTGANSVPYTNRFNQNGAAPSTTVPATHGAFLYVFDAAADGSHPWFPGVNGAAFDDFVLTRNGTQLAADNFNHTAGVLYPASPWTVDVSAAHVAGSTTPLETTGSVAHSGANWTPDLGCFCNGPSAMTPVTNSGTRVISVKIAQLPALAVMVTGFIEISTGDVGVEAVIADDGHLELVSGAAGTFNLVAQSSPGAISAGDTLTLQWNGTTAVAKVNGTTVLSGTP